MKFIVDVNLGKLAKWLRILGFDTISYSGKIGRDLLRKAEQEERVVLTRKKDMSKRQFSGELVVITRDHAHEQLREIMEKLSIRTDTDRMFSICTKCNEVLIEIKREDVSGIVPEHVFASHTTFHTCMRCKSVFWPGTHVVNAHSFFKTHIQTDHP